MVRIIDSRCVVPLTLVLGLPYH